MASDPFISRQDLSDHLGRDVSADDGAVICVDAACDMVRTYAEQNFNRGTSTQAFDGTGTDALLLPELPVNSVGTVSVDGTAAGTVDYTLNGNGVLLATNTAGAAFGTTWPAGRQNISVTYDHGYDLDDIPRDVRIVALSIAERLLVQGPTVFESIGQSTVRYGTNSTDLTNGERAILRKYRRYS